MFELRLITWHYRSWLRFQLQNLDRWAQQIWFQTCAGGSWCCLCCKMPAHLHCGPGTRLFWESGGHWCFCPPCCARRSSLCLNRGGSRICHCSPADTVSSCPFCWCSWRPRRWRIPHSTRSPSRSDLQTGPLCTAPGQSCQTSLGCLRTAAGLWFGWLFCCSQRCEAPYRLCYGPISVGRNLKKEQSIHIFIVFWD